MRPKIWAWPHDYSSSMHARITIFAYLYLGTLYWKKGQLTLTFKVIYRQMFRLPYLRNGLIDWHQTKTILIDGLQRTSLYKFRSLNLTYSLLTDFLVILSVEGRGVLQRVPMLLSLFRREGTKWWPGFVECGCFTVADWCEKPSSHGVPVQHLCHLPSWGCSAICWNLWPWVIPTG